MKIGIDIGGSHIAVGLVDNEGKIIQKIERNIEKQENIEEYVVNYVDKAIEKIIQTANIKRIGIAAPGNPNGTIITNLVNLGTKKIDFKILEEKYNVKIQSINDGKAAAIAEKQYGAMRDHKDCVFLCLGTGIGGAVFLNNQLLQASRNPGFELGHMVIDKNGKTCNCGKKGCFETYCSMKRLKEKLQEVLERMLQNKKVQDAIELKELVYANKENNQIKEILDEYIDNLIIGLSNIIDIFEPKIICLGGSFVYFKEILYNELVSKMEEKRYVFNKGELPKIVLAELQNDAGIIGATLIN